MTCTIKEPTQTLPEQSAGVERLLTIQDAAAILGVHVWALRRAVKAGVIPAYAPFNGRKLVRVGPAEPTLGVSSRKGIRKAVHLQTSHHASKRRNPYHYLDYSPEVRISRGNA